MNMIYSWLRLLPFAWVEYDFMLNALLAIVLLAPVFGILGTMIVNNRMAFFSDALGHGAFTGVAIGGVMGLIEPLWSAIIFALLFSVGIAAIKHKSSMASDTVIGVFSSTAIALGIFIQTAGGRSFAKALTYLVGDILSILPREIMLLSFLLIFILLLWVFIFNKLLVTSINSSLAGSRGIHTFWYEMLFSMVIAVVVTVAMSWIGLLVINAFLVLPAAAARNISKNQRQYHFLTIAISSFAGIAGLLLSYYFETATGATIVLVAAVIFFLTYTLRKKFA